MFIKLKNKIAALLNKVVSTSFLILLGVAFILWFIMRLSRPYTTSIDIEVVLEEDYNSTLAIDKESIWVTATVNGDGRDLIYYKAGMGTSIKVPISQLQFIKVNDDKTSFLYNIERESMERAINSNESKFNIVAITDTITKVNLSQIQTKRVPIIPRINIDCTEQYILNGKITLSQDSIDIRGGELALQSVNQIYTNLKEIKNAQADLSGTISLDLPKEIRAKEQSVKYYAKVMGYTEIIYTVDITSKEDEIILAIPSKVTITAKVSLDAKIDDPTDSVEAVTSKPNKNSVSDEVRKVEINNLPSNVIDYSISPEFVKIYHIE